MNDYNNSDKDSVTPKGQLALQILIDTEIRKLNNSLDDTYEPYMLESVKFKTAIANARKKLSITGTNNVPQDSIPALWAAWHILKQANKPATYRNYMESIQAVESIMHQALDESGLSDKWGSFVSYYVIELTPPPSYSVNDFHPAKIISIEEDGIVIKIEKGIRYEEFINIWKPVASHLGKGHRKVKHRPNQARDAQIFVKKHRLGLSNRQLARDYIGGEEVYDIDTIKKVLKRQKNLFDEGTDLTK